MRLECYAIHQDLLDTARCLVQNFSTDKDKPFSLSADRPPSWVDPGSLEAREWQILVDDFGLGQALVKPDERPSAAPGTIDETTDLLRTAKDGVERWRRATETDLRIAQDLVKDRV